MCNVGTGINEEFLSELYKGIVLTNLRYIYFKNWVIYGAMAPKTVHKVANFTETIGQPSI